MQKTGILLTTWAGVCSARNIFILALFLASSPSHSEDIKISMRRAFEAFRTLQPFLVDSKSFGDPANDKVIYTHISSLRDDFHDIRAFPTRFQSQPGFVSNVTVVEEILDDAAKRFREGKKSYAAWRLRGIAQNCISCHATYNIHLTFHDEKAPKLEGLNDLQKGEFYLATRQLEEAEKYLRSALKESEPSADKMNVLRRLLTLYVRIKGDSSLALTGLQEATKDLALPLQDREEVAAWLTSLKVWNETKGSLGTVSQAHTLIKRSLSHDDLLAARVDAVGLLRATSDLHKLLALPKLTSADRSEALYLLGLSYSKLPLFFIDELPEVYLRQCIDESPGSKIAQRSYRLYEEIVELAFTGSSGTNLPTDVRLKLMEFHDKAYGIPAVDGKV